MTLDSLLGLFERACDHWLSGQPASTKEPVAIRLYQFPSRLSSSSHSWSTLHHSSHTTKQEPVHVFERLGYHTRNLLPRLLYSQLSSTRPYHHVHPTAPPKNSEKGTRSGRSVIRVFADHSPSSCPRLSHTLHTPLHCLYLSLYPLASL